jgi:hypothetical protein
VSIQGALNTAIYTAIGGTVTTAGTAVFFEKAPDKYPMPYVVWDYVNEADVNDTSHRLKNCVIFARAYASKPDTANGIDAQIDNALHRKTLTITGWNNIQTQRENGMSTVETDSAGVKTYMCGADYRILADQ